MFAIITWWCGRGNNGWNFDFFFCNSIWWKFFFFRGSPALRPVYALVCPLMPLWLNWRWCVYVQSIRTKRNNFAICLRNIRMVFHCSAREKKKRWKEGIKRESSKSRTRKKMCKSPKEREWLSLKKHKLRKHCEMKWVEICKHYKKSKQNACIATEKKN